MVGDTYRFFCPDVVLYDFYCEVESHGQILSHPENQWENIDIRYLNDW